MEQDYEAIVKFQPTMFEIEQKTAAPNNDHDYSWIESKFTQMANEFKWSTMAVKSVVTTANASDDTAACAETVDDGEDDSIEGLLENDDEVVKQAIDYPGSTTAQTLSTTRNAESKLAGRSQSEAQPYQKSQHDPQQHEKFQSLGFEVESMLFPPGEISHGPLQSELNKYKFHFNKYIDIVQKIFSDLKHFIVKQIVKSKVSHFLSNLEVATASLVQWLRTATCFKPFAKLRNFIKSIVDLESRPVKMIAGSVQLLFASYLILMVVGIYVVPLFENYIL